MKYPQLKFKLNSKADKENAELFVKYSFGYLKWFLPNKLQYLIPKKMSKTELVKAMQDYVDKNFSEEKFKIQKNVIKASKEWGFVENKFFKIVDKIFNGHPWPKGKYIGYASIFCMYPRHVWNKTFFFPGIIYNKKTPPAKNVIAHEMLHFIFFDYIKKRYGLNPESKIKDKEEKYLWKVSEVFNFVIESWRPYNKIFKRGGPPYVGKSLYKKMRPQWVKNPDIDMLLDKWFKQEIKF